jgi:hypothetical protein
MSPVSIDCRRRALFAIIAFTVVPCVAAAPFRAAALDVCVGDCDSNGTVTVDELIRGVAIALGSQPADVCPTFECNGRGVQIDCLVRAVASALQGCEPAPPPTSLEGPVTGGKGAPFIAGTTFELSDVGYMQTEYFVAGTAAAYVNDGPLGDDGKWTVEPGATAAYKTRILVYRPIDPDAFNGTVIVEWLNVSGGVETGPDWLNGHTEMIRSGYVWVGVSAQKLGIDGGTPLLPIVSLPLKQADPERYASLVHPGDSFSYDIFTQAAQAVRHPHGTNPLGDLTPHRMIAAGESQSAFRMVTYANAIHPLAHVFDGFLVHSRGGIPAPLSEAPQPAITVPGTAPIRDDIDVPVLIFETETDLTLLLYASARQPDSTHVRTWEVAGTSHVDAYTVGPGMADRGDSPDIANLIITTMPLPGVISCPTPVNSGPQHFVLNAAVAALDRWVRDGTAPEPAPRIELADGGIARDANGNAVGGIRTPQVDVPIAVLTGQGEGNVVCQIFGKTIPFDETTLTLLYPDHDAYVTAYDAATDAAVAAGYILPADAALMKAAAASAAIPQ